MFKRLNFLFIIIIKNKYNMNCADLPADNFFDVDVNSINDTVNGQNISTKSIPLNFSKKPEGLKQVDSYSDIVKQAEVLVNKEPTKEPVRNEVTKTSQVQSICTRSEGANQNKKRTGNYCYTCKPRGKVLKHIIKTDTVHGVVFHYDLHKRPLILLTPIKHYGTIYDIPDQEVINIFKGIKLFCEEWNIVDYQTSYNSGEWQTHSHFHIKIKTSEKIINRLRRDHFLRIKLQQNYK